MMLLGAHATGNWLEWRFWLNVAVSQSRKSVSWYGVWFGLTRRVQRMSANEYSPRGSTYYGNAVSWPRLNVPWTGNLLTNYPSA